MKIKSTHLASAAGVLFIASLIISLMTALHGSMNGNLANPRYVTVSGDGSVKVTPDSVRVDASVSNVASTSAASLAATAKSADQLRTSLKGAGVDAKYIQAVNLSTNPCLLYTSDAADE